MTALNIDRQPSLWTIYLFLHPYWLTCSLLWFRAHRGPLLARDSCWHHPHPTLSQQHHYHWQDMHPHWRVEQCGYFKVHHFQHH